MQDNKNQSTYTPDSNIETMYDFQLMDVDTYHYGDCFELAGRFGPHNIIDDFAFESKATNCFMGYIGHDEREAEVEICFTKAKNFPIINPRTRHKSLYFDILWNRPDRTWYTGGYIRFIRTEKSVKMCFLKSDVPAAAEVGEATPDLITQAEALQPYLQPISRDTIAPRPIDLNNYGGIDHIGIRHYGTTIYLFERPNPQKTTKIQQTINNNNSGNI